MSTATKAPHDEAITYTTTGAHGQSILAIHDVSKRKVAPRDPVAALAAAKAARLKGQQAMLAQVQADAGRAPTFTVPAGETLVAARARLASLNARQAEARKHVSELTAREAPIRTRARELAAAAALGDIPQSQADEARIDALEVQRELDGAKESLAAIDAAIPTQAERVQAEEVVQKKHAAVSCVAEQQRLIPEALKLLDVLHELEAKLQDVESAARIHGAYVQPVSQALGIFRGDPRTVNSASWLAIDRLRRSGFADLPCLKDYP